MRVVRMMRRSLTILATLLFLTRFAVGQQPGPLATSPAAGASEFEELDKAVEYTKLSRKAKFELVRHLRTSDGREAWCGKRFEGYLKELKSTAEYSNDATFWNEVKQIYDSPIVKQDLLKSQYALIQGELLKRNPIKATLKRADNSSITGNSTIEVSESAEQLTYSIEANSFVDDWGGFECEKSIGGKVLNVPFTQGTRSASFQLAAVDLGSLDSVEVEFTAKHKTYKEFSFSVNFKINKKYETVKPPEPQVEKPLILDSPESIANAINSVKDKENGKRDAVFDQLRSKMISTSSPQPTEISVPKQLDFAIVVFGTKADDDRCFTKEKKDAVKASSKRYDRNQLLNGTVTKIVVCPASGRADEAIQLIEAARGKNRLAWLAPNAANWESKNANTVGSVATVACMLSDKISEATCAQGMVTLKLRSSDKKLIEVGLGVPR